MKLIYRQLRKRFEQQMELEIKPIKETPVQSKSWDYIPALIKFLFTMYTTPFYNEQVFSVLEERILSCIKAASRTGLTLRQILVLVQNGLALRINYGCLDDMLSYHSGLRQLWGIDNCTDFGSDRFIDFGYGNCGQRSFIERWRPRAAQRRNLRFRS